MNDIRSRMQRIGKAVEKELPEGHGFFVLCFPFNDPNARGEYVSNEAIAIRDNIRATVPK